MITDLKATLEAEHSITITESVITWVSNHQSRFDELFILFCGNDKKLAQRSAWPLSYIVIRYPELLKKHFAKFLQRINEKKLHDGIVRNGLRLLQHYPIPEKYLGQVMEFCFGKITTPGEKPAIKAFSLQVLQNMAATYPEILPELKTIISMQWNYESKAFKSKARKVLGLKPNETPAGIE